MARSVHLVTILFDDKHSLQFLFFCWLDAFCSFSFLFVCFNPIVFLPRTLSQSLNLNRNKVTEKQKDPLE